jgi:hypothetical protein
MPMGMKYWNYGAMTERVSPNMGSSGRAVNNAPVLMLRRAAQLWR